MRRVRHLMGDQRGVSVLELGFVLPILAFLVMGVTDLARGFAARLSLEQAAYRALEKATVGSVQSDYSSLATEAQTAAGAGSTATVDQWLECDGVRQTSFSGACTSTQMTSRYVKVTVTQNFAPTFSWAITPWHFFNTNSDGTITLTGFAALRVQ